MGVFVCMPHVRQATYTHVGACTQLEEDCMTFKAGHLKASTAAKSQDLQNHNLLSVQVEACLQLSYFTIMYDEASVLKPVRVSYLQVS